ncbi:protein of unknown function [Pseudorhizobium banfieldiae]|uniref:Uncharacterized protein n=1 Tax=Pseudorhizobium banfieldiae TaxID=1125847 RepID=L0NFJ1_9HYPH|nr:hypothetical protein [Pseudorhizobium banfieldiae]CAD6605823.1 hypothetical protein RNT25_01731 [arsenite-oxidising bacterium NT-25]CCF19077.1 protein of unknown function [Pseudorhizobium banfieldiae]
MTQPLPYIFRWNRQGRKGQPCEVLIRTNVMNTRLVRFADGYTMVTSGNALKKNPEAQPT